MYYRLFCDNEIKKVKGNFFFIKMKSKEGFQRYTWLKQGRNSRLSWSSSSRGHKLAACSENDRYLDSPEFLFLSCTVNSACWKRGCNRSLMFSATNLRVTRAHLSIGYACRKILALITPTGSLSQCLDNRRIIVLYCNGFSQAFPILCETRRPRLYYFEHNAENRRWSKVGIFINFVCPWKSYGLFEWISWWILFH